MMVISSVHGTCRAEVPNRTPEQLREMSESIVVGVVKADFVSRVGRRADHLTEIKVLESEAGVHEVGDVVGVSWFRQEQFPGSVGTNGHRGELPEVGEIVRVYITGGGAAVLPNGFAEVEPRFVTAGLLESGDTEELRAAVDRAREAGALVEAEAGARRLLELEGRAADRVLIGRLVVEQLRFAEAMEVLEPLALKKEPTGDEAGAVREGRQDYLFAAWSLGDEAFEAALERLARLDERFKRYRDRWAG